MPNAKSVARYPGRFNAIRRAFTRKRVTVNHSNTVLAYPLPEIARLRSWGRGEQADGVGDRRTVNATHERTRTTTDLRGSRLLAAVAETNRLHLAVHEHTVGVLGTFLAVGDEAAHIWIHRLLTKGILG